MKKIKVFETFSGVGAQNSALKNLKQKGILDYEIVGTSDWDVYATQSYASIHHSDYKKFKDPTEKELDDFINNNTFSLDGKNPFTSFKRYSDNTYINWYKAYKKSRNIGSIVDSFERVKTNILEEHGNIDLLTYSFPCQDLSSAGNFHGFNEGIKKHTRSGLLYEIEKLLKKLSIHSLNNNKVERERERERERRWNKSSSKILTTWKCS